MLILAVAVAGGVGAVARYTMEQALVRRWKPRWPMAIMAVNLTGSLILGLLVGLAGVYGHGQPEWLTVAGSGLLGGYTTFSTASVEAITLMTSRQPGHGLAIGCAHAIGQLAACTALALAGLCLGDAVR